MYGKYNTDPYEKLEFDLLYINKMSVLTDIQLLFATFGILFSKESTEGIEAGQVTAAGENYITTSSPKEAVIDYDNETLRAEDAEEVARQWAD